MSKSFITFTAKKSLNKKLRKYEGEKGTPSKLEGPKERGVLWQRVRISYENGFSTIVKFLGAFFKFFLQEPILNINDERQWGDEAMMLSRPSRSRLPCGHDASKYKQKHCVKYY